MIPYGRQNISQNDIDAVVDVLQSDFLTQGPQVPKFEAAVAKYSHAKHAVATNSATSALHIACLALGLGEGDWLWTSPITFVASANCGLYCGAKIDFVDIDSKSYSMSAGALRAKLRLAKKENCLPKVVIPVHFSGQPCEMTEIFALSKEYGFSIIEDASHAIGGRYNNEPIGSGRYSDITVFSFHPVKIVTTGEGGMALTNNIALAEKMALLRSHGITRDPKLMDDIPDGDWYYQQVDLGFNYRMTELQAALGRSQMGRLDSFVEKRHVLAGRYNEMLSALPVIVPYQSDDSYSSFHLYVIRLKLEKITKSHKDIFRGLREKGIGVNLHYIPVYRQPYYRAKERGQDFYPESESYYQEAISLPLFPTLSEEDQDEVCRVLREELL